jgi:hypothetical protein
MASIRCILVHNYFSPFKDPMSILSALIRIFGQTHYNHCELLIEENGEKYVIGAVYPKVRKVDYDTWYNLLPRDFKVVDIISNKSQLQMIEDAKKQVGKRYDIISLLYYIPTLILLKKLMKNTKTSYCYEVAAGVAGYKDSYSILPNEFIEKLTV